jgi:hypothetical protein
MQKLSLRALLAAVGALGVCACSGSGAGDQGTCAGVNAPTVLTLVNLVPALGDSVPNRDIVHSFSIADDLVFSDIALAYLETHTAGTPEPALQFTYTIAEQTTDLTSSPVVWTSAPGHVELGAPLVYQTPDGCAYELPSPLFSYDVTAP